MSEYWVSHKRFLCKYCNIYIADDKPSRTQHENGLRHKGNVERFVRGLYKEGEKRVREREEEKGVMAGVSKAAEAAYALDVAQGRASTSSAAASTSRAPPAPAPKPKPAKPTNPYANYTTAASLGYRDPDVEEAERKKGMGIPGQWTVVMPASEVEPQEAGDIKPEVGMDPARYGEDSKKRSFPTTEHDSEDSRTFKLRKKTVELGLGEIYDPGIIPIKLKAQKKEEDEVEELKPGVGVTGETNEVTSDMDGQADGPKLSTLLKWTKVQWKKASDDTPAPGPETDVPLPTLTPVTMGLEASEDTSLVDSGLDSLVPVFTRASSPPTAANGVKKEESEAVRLTDTDTGLTPLPSQTMSLFRKRKIPAGRRGA